MRSSSAPSCEDGAHIVRRVEAELGRRAFSESATTIIEGQIERKGAFFEADISVREGGRSLGSRHLSSGDANCAGLEDAVVLAIALVVDSAPAHPPSTVGDAEVAARPSAVLDPVAGSRSARASSSESSVSVAGSGLEPALEDDSGSVSDSPRRTAPLESASMAVRALLAFGLLPTAAAGVGMATAVPVTRRYYVTIGLLYFPPTEADRPDFDFGLAAASLGACAEVEEGRLRLSSCASASLGAIHVHSSVLQPVGPADRAWAAASISAHARMRLVGPLFTELGAEMLFPVTREEFAIEGQADTVFQESAVTGLVQAGVGLSIP